MTRVQRRMLLGLGGLVLAGCAKDDGGEARFDCVVDQPFPYPDTSYVGVHGNRANNDFIPCDTATAYGEAWSALEAGGAAQPNTFSPDGTVTYATTTPGGAGGCTVHALDVDRGEVLWCASIPQAYRSSVEVDEDGNLFVTAESEVVSLDPDGTERWVTALPQMAGEGPVGGIGLHFDANGHVATVDDGGTVHLLRRSDGELLASFSIPDAFGLVPPASVTGDLDFASLLPEAVVADFELLAGDDIDQFLAVFAGGGSFSDNTLGVGPDGHLYVIGGGLTPETGALVQVRVGGSADAPTLSAGWRLDTVGGSATSPSISPDGRFVSVGDGSSLTSFLAPRGADARIRVVDITACDDNTDGDPEPGICLEKHAVPFASGPSLGSMPMLDGEVHYAWEVQVAFLLDNTLPDVRAFRGSETSWETFLPGDRQWTAVLTVTNNHIIGTATRLTPSTESILTVPLPATATSELIVIDRSDGELVFTAPVSDDATSTVTVGPDGSLYVNKLGLVHGLAVDTPLVGGLTRFEPIE